MTTYPWKQAGISFNLWYQLFLPLCFGESARYAGACKRTRQFDWLDWFGDDDSAKVVEESQAKRGFCNA